MIVWRELVPDARRIVFVLSQYSVGGAEKQLATLLEHRPEWARGLGVHTITFIASASSEIVERFAALGVIHTLVERQGRSFAAFFLALVRTIRRLDPFIVHTLLDHSTGTWGRLAAWLLRSPVIMMSDLSLGEGGGRAHFALRPFLDRVTTRFLPNAEAIADRLASKGVPREKITVIPCGVDLRTFDPLRAEPTRAARREAWGVGSDAVVAGFLGRFWEQKRVDLLAEALRAMPVEERPDLVVFAGDGPTMPMVRAIIDQDPWLKAHTRFLGTIHDTPAFLSAVDYLVLPSVSEGLPNVVLESMAMCRPVVSTRVSDIPLVIDGAGLVAEPGDVGSLARALSAMQCYTDDERRRLGDVGRRRVERDFDIVHVAERFWRAHAELLPAFEVPPPRPRRSEQG